MSVVKADDRSGQPIEFRQLHRGRVQHFASLGTARDSAGDSFPQFRGIADGAEHDLRLGVIRHDVGRAPTTESCRYSTCCGQAAGLPATESAECRGELRAAYGWPNAQARDKRSAQVFHGP